MTKKSLVSIRSIIAFKTLTIRIRPLRGPCGSIDQYCVHHHLAMQSLLKVQAEDTGYHSLRRFTGRWSVEERKGSSLSSVRSGTWNPRSFFLS